jgi:signal transduction histidine kinase/ligand-binding sensor domain-containing protein
MITKRFVVRLHIETEMDRPGQLRRSPGSRWQSASDPEIRRGSRSRDVFLIARLFVWLATLLWVINPAHAQYGFENWTVDNGLPENEIRGITQTPDGYLWIATLNGLTRFDGVRMTIFTRKTPGLSSNQFGTIMQGRGGDLWIDTVVNGLVRYHDGSFRAYGKQQGIPGEINGLTDDDSGDLWVLSAGRILRWNEAADRFLDIAPGSRNRLYRNFNWESRGFWARDNDRLHCFIRGRFVDYTLPPGIVQDEFWGAVLDPTGTIWIETIGGKQVRITPDNVSHMVKAGSAPDITFSTAQGDSWTIHVGPRFRRSIEFLSSNRAVSIPFTRLYEDHQGTLWIGTIDHGLFRMQKQSIETYTTEQGLVDRDTYAIYQDHAGAVWIGAWHSGVSHFANGKFTNYTMADGLPNELVTALFEDREGRFWVGTHGGLTVFDNGRFHPVANPAFVRGDVVQAITQDRDGTLWFGTRGGLVRFRDGATRFFTQKDGLASDGVYVIITAHNGDLWAGGNGGLTRIRGGQFTRWTEKDGLASGNIWTIYEDKDGVLWIGTYDGGLERFADGRFTSYTVKDGLYDDSVFGILEDSYGYFWISSDHGIYQVSKADLNAFAAGNLETITSIAYGKVDGMLTIQCNGGLWPSAARTRDGKLWFPTLDGVAVIDPATVTHNRVPPAVTIESAMIDNVPAPIDDGLRIPPSKADVEINYAALSFIHAAQNHYRYRLEGLDSDWVRAGTRRVAYYSHLPPGKYVFHVIAGNSDGIWNTEGKTLNVTVLAPYYETWWFEMLVLFCVGAMVAAAWRFRVSQLQQAQAAQQAFSRQLIASQEAERKRIASEMHDSLGQRLVVIKNLALFLLRSRRGTVATENDAETITEISDETSSAIEETRAISYNLRPFQLDRLGLTKAVEAMIRRTETASGIHFASDLDNIDDLFAEELRINFYRIVQESLGNIMKHSQATEVAIRLKRSPENVVLTIEDNGRGFIPGAHASPASDSGFGLTGMAERASLLGGVFKVRSTPDRGTTVTVEIRLKSRPTA